MVITNAVGLYWAVMPPVLVLFMSLAAWMSLRRTNQG